MKTQLYRRTALGLTLAVLPFVGGCEAEEGSSTPSLISAAFGDTVAQPITSKAATNENPTVATAETAEIEPVAEAKAGASELPAKNSVPAGELALPSFIRPASPLADVVKLAQSGVDAGVMLTYITNSASTFSLGADEIIYLNDLGMPSEMITAIMEHDKAMKLFWANSQPQPAAAPEPAPAPVSEVAPVEQTAAAPTYVSPPVAEAAPVDQQPVNVTYNYFYDTLSPYGSWIEVDGYGMCWQPSVVVVNRGWQPYCDGGRWMYTDGGWYWYSDYTWGWAPFHYGRWFSHPRWGWCWYPGYTWGPAWVTWRYNEGYCGWAPLPPAAHYTTGFGFTYYGSSVGVSFGFGLGYSYYTFVPWNRFCNYRPSVYHAPRNHAKDIYHNTTVINNVINGDNNTIINGGVPVERVRAASKTDIQKVALRDFSGTPTLGGRRERLESDGRTLAVHRPRPPQSSLTPASTSSEARRGFGGTGTRSAISQSGQPDSNRDGGGLEQRPVVTRPTQKPGVLPTSGRTSVTAEESISRPTTTAPAARGFVAAQESPATETTMAPRPRTIDIPVSRSAARPTARAELPENSAASFARSSERSGAVAPLIVRGTERVSEPTTARPGVPQASAPFPREQTSRPSVVVIGRREGSTSSSQIGVPSSQPQGRSPEFARPESRSSTVNAASERPSYSRPVVPQREYSRPQISSPAMRSSRSGINSRSSFSVPSQRSSMPAPSVVPRPSASTSTPQFSRPSPAPTAASRPQPASPSFSAPRSAPTPAPAARPSPSQSPSSSRSSSRNN